MSGQEDILANPATSVERSFGRVQLVRTPAADTPRKCPLKAVARESFAQLKVKSSADARMLIESPLPSGFE